MTSVKALAVFLIVISTMTLSSHVSAQGSSPRQVPLPSLAWTSFRFELDDNGGARVTTFNYLQADKQLVSYLVDYFNRTKETQLQTMSAEISAEEASIGEKLGRVVRSSDLKLGLSVTGNFLIIEREWTWSSFATRDTFSWVTDAFSALPMSISSSGNLTIVFPKGAQISSTNPQEDKRFDSNDRSTLLYIGPRTDLGPIIRYQTYWDRLVPPVIVSILAIAIAVGYLVFRRTRKGGGRKGDKLVGRGRRKKGTSGDTLVRRGKRSSH